MKRGFICAMLLLGDPVMADVILSPVEISQTLSLGPWPPEPEPDKSNRVSGDRASIALGEDLFADPILSKDASLACSSCHDPAQGFTVPLPRAVGREVLDRNSPSVVNLGGLRWFGWGGKSDNLWAASLHPIVADQEMAHSPQSLQAALSASRFKPAYEAIFGPIDTQPPEAVLVNTAKALAAYQEVLVTRSTAFDVFRDALEEQDHATALSYPEAAQRGLRIFLGRGNCIMCHSGPRFSNNEFHDAGVSYFIDETTVDQGRFGGLKFLLSNPYTLAGEWSDDEDKQGAWAVRNVRQTHADFGTFKTPSLRGVVETAPYMHNGSLPDLTAVVRHYNEIDLERMHADGEAILQPLNLSEAEISDVVAFLETLSEVSD
ncbi:MAG: cytochrome c peroxidase [Tateyamaria sp.]|uniref:cytochrome-c peroxidase n=1 Tax=Roseobacteraceae TaxID=2854170 RepID=UPI003274D9E4